MAAILETGYTWTENLNGVFDPSDGRLVEVFGSDGYTDYDGDVLPIVREYTVTGTRYNRFGYLVNTVTSIDTVNGVTLVDNGDKGTFIQRFGLTLHF